jgi:hypothetical protein
MPSQTNAEITKVDTYVKTMEEALKVNTRVVMCVCSYMYLYVCVYVFVLVSLLTPGMNIGKLIKV